MMVAVFRPIPHLSPTDADIEREYGYHGSSDLPGVYFVTRFCHAGPAAALEEFACSAGSS